MYTQWKVVLVSQSVLVQQHKMQPDVTDPEFNPPDLLCRMSGLRSGHLKHPSLALFVSQRSRKRNTQR